MYVNGVLLSIFSYKDYFISLLNCYGSFSKLLMVFVALFWH